MIRMHRGVLALAAVVGLTACGSGGSSKASSATYGSACPSASTVAGSDLGPETNPPGDIPDNQAFVAYSPPDNLYTVKVPEGWARRESADGVTFTDKLNRIEVRVVDAAAAPTVDSATAADVPAVAAGAACFSLGQVRAVSRPAGTAVLLTYQADAAADPVTGKVVHDDVERYAFWKDGKEVVLTLSGPAGSDNVDPWRIVTDSFGWR
ncbi:MAG: hypothetical protein QOH36_2418 [Actinomycetota bacterium]|nr:hypothetical protein [Actinomycetota bacterium]